MEVIDLGQLAYRDAWAVQERIHADVLAGGEAKILLVEHFPVITFGRRPGVERNLLVEPAELTRRRIELVQSDRGGDITYHGPGQLVCYPIVRLADFGLGVGDYVHGLERAVIRSLSGWGIGARADPAAVGVWTDDVPPAKVCAIGVRVRRGVSLHGLALNVSTDLAEFDRIVPCGLAGRPVTSLQKLLGQRCPAMAAVKAELAAQIGESLKGLQRTGTLGTKGPCVGS